MIRVVLGGAGLVAMLLATPQFLVTRSIDDQMSTGSIALPEGAAESFRLISSADDMGCAIAAGMPGGEVRRPLQLDANCIDAVPLLARAHWWLDRPDGTVAFVDDTGEAVAEFAEADGAAFESYLPRQPIMILVAE